MKVLIVAGKNENGGAPRSMIELIKHISGAYGVEYTVIAHKEGKITAFCRDNNIEYCVDGHEPIVIGKGSTFLRRFAKLALRPFFMFKAGKNKKALAAIEKKLNLNEFDLIHTNSNRDGIGAMIAHKYHIPHIWHLREFGKEDYDTVFLPPYSVDYMNQTADRFIAISDAVAEAWRQKGLDKSKIVRIYNGVDLSMIESDADRKPLDDRQLKMVFTGTVCPAKGQNEIIEAIGLLRKEDKERVSVDFYGDGVSEYIGSLKKRAEEMGLEDNIRFLGHCDNIGSCLKNYSVGLVCSRAEAFGRITPEYMAAGLITIVCDTGANPELIEDGKTGFIYKRSDYEDFASVIRKVLYMEQEEKMTVSHAAEQYARKNFTAEKNAKNIFQLYREKKKK